MLAVGACDAGQDGSHHDSALGIVTAPVSIPPLIVSVQPLSPTTDKDVKSVLVSPSGAALNGLTSTTRFTERATQRVWDQKTLPASMTTRGQIWDVRITLRAADGTTRSGTTSFTVANSAPKVASATVVGSSRCGEFTCTAGAVTDLDGDATSLKYKWYVNNSELTGATNKVLPVGQVRLGQLVSCGVRAADQSKTGGEARSPQVVATEAPPFVESVSTNAYSRAGDRLTCRAFPLDDSCTAPSTTSTGTFTYTWAVNGAAVSGATDATFDTTGLAGGDRVTCSASANGSGPGTSPETVLLPGRWVIRGTLDKGQAGYAVSVIDDLDGDQRAEIAIGAPNTSPAGALQAGALYIVSGRENLATLDLDTLINQPQGSGPAGRYLPGERGSFDVGLMACGPEYYVGGCPKIRDTMGEIMADIEGPRGAGLGFAVGYAGDTDGDGVGDLITSAPYELIGDLWTGHTYMLSGSNLDGRPLEDAGLGNGGFLFRGECPRRRGTDIPVSHVESTSISRAGNGDLSGYRVVGLGDVNGDGLGDFAVSAPNHGDRDEGTVYVVYGRDDGMEVTGTDIFERGCGFSNGYADPPYPAEVARPGLLAGVAGFAAYGPNLPMANAFPIRWGKLLAPAGDFNGDGYDDLLVPTPGFSAASNSTYLFLGGPSRNSAAISGRDVASRWEIWLGSARFVNGVSSGRFGLGLPSGGGGDVNGDGYDDLVFSENDLNRQTFMEVLYGRPSDDDGILRTDEIFDGSGRGFAVGGVVDASTESGIARVVGDLNGDGFDDVALGVPSHGNPDVGGVFVVFGAATPPSGLTLAGLRNGIGGFAVEGTTAGTQFGSSLDGGDVDGDGFDDLVIGAPGAAGAAGQAMAGQVTVVFGRDYSRTVSGFGSPNNDSLVGTPAGDALIGGRGHDELIGNGGADVLYGGAGDDILRVSDSSYRRVRGGAGEDTLVLEADVTAMTLDARRVREIERIRLAGQSITVSRRDLVRLSDTSNRLIIDGHGQVATAAGDHWRDTGTETLAGVTYITLEDGHAELWIATTLATRIPPTVLDAAHVVPENAALESVVATFGAIDPDGPETDLRWTLADDPSGAFALDPISGTLRVTDPLVLDFETEREPWMLDVIVTDGAGLASYGQFEVTLGDVNEAPVFVTDAPRMSAEEDVEGSIGRVDAVDPDMDAVVEYLMGEDPSGLFVIDAITGDIGLRPAAQLDYETTTLHSFTVIARDQGGLSDTVSVTVDVLDRDILERHVRVTFDARGRSVWDDSTSAAFDGFALPGLTDQQVTTTCVEHPAGEEAHTESWNAAIPGVGNLLAAMPIRFEARYTGKVCTKNELVFDEGTWNASVPVDIDLTLPDEIRAGTTITLGSSATVSDDAKLWGRTTGIEMGWTIAFEEFGVFMGVCNDLFGHTCKTILEKGNLTKSFTDRWGSESRSWEGGKLGAPAADGSVTIGLEERVENDTLTIAVNWDEYLFSALTYMGLPSNKGRFDWVLEGAGGGADKDLTIRFDYNILSTSVGFQTDNAWRFRLKVKGVNATVALENGTIRTFRVGTPYALVVPANADVDNDGKVDASISFALDAEFENVWDHHSNSGYIYTGGFGRIRVLDDRGIPTAERKVGPAFQKQCGPKVGGNPMAALKCYTSDKTHTVAFEPHGFTVPEIAGSLDLTGP